MSSFWSSPTVQSVAKYTAAAGAAGLSMGGFFKLLHHVSGHSAAKTLENLQQSGLLSDTQLQTLAQEPALMELMDRMSEYRSMAKQDFQHVIEESVRLAQMRHTFYQIEKPRFSDAKSLRACSQEWIEAIRGMRNLLELKRPDVLEAFDEVAADCQSYHTELSEGALMDAQLSR